MITEKRYAWDREDFREWWKINGDLNPDINPKTLRAHSKTILYERGKNGIEAHIARVILQRKKIYYRGALARDSEEFMKYFVQSLNPHIDLATLRQNDTKTKFTFVNENNELKSIILKSFFNNIRKYGKYTYQSNRKKAKDFPAFMEWFERYKKYNPHINIDDLCVIRDGKTVLYYPMDSGRLKSITLAGLLVRKDIFRYTNTTERNLASNNKAFLRFFEKEEYLNKNFDLNNTSKFRTEIKMRYLTVNNTVEEKNMPAFFQAGSKHGFSMPADSVQKYISEELSNDLIREKFTGDGSDIICKCSAGHSYKVKPKSFLKKKGICPCQVCKSAAGADPEIKLFWGDNKISPDRVSAYDQRKYNFVCPYCGYKFRKALMLMTLKYPKCPNCKDIGETEAKEVIQEAFPIGTLFAMRRNEINDGLQDNNKMP